MRAEIIAVGTEILLGEIVNTNAQATAQLLAQTGVTAHYQTVVGDNPERLIQAIINAENRSDILILIGGLGPTPDDLTKQTLAKHLQLDLLTDEVALDKLKHWQQQTKRNMSANNLAQALYLASGEVLSNPVGLAVGSYVQTSSHYYFVLPGPPREFVPMLDQEVAPRIRQLTGSKLIIASTMYRFFGLGESAIATELASLLQLKNPTLATYLKGFEIGVRITAQAETMDQAKALIAPVAAQVKQILAPYYTGVGENRRLVGEVVNLLQQKQLTITAAESLTAGLFQAEIAAVSGASQVFNGGVVTYSNAAKTKLLGIDAKLIAANGVVSEVIAKLMAEQSRQLMGTDFALGFTGVAGPAELEGHPAGTVYIALAQVNKATKVYQYHLAGQRNEVRERAVLSGLKLVYDCLINEHN